MKLRRLSTRAAGFDAKLAALTRYEAAQDPAVQKTVRRILAEVRARGDAAVRKYAKKFDGVALRQFEIPRTEIQKAIQSVPRAQADALQSAFQRIKSFHERQLQKSWDYTDEGGTRLGQRVTALERVGLYVPGGKAAYPSTVLMNAVPAKVAGVRELLMASPNPNPLVLAAAALAGVDRVFGIGGAQAVAALAYGTASIPRVDVVAGPGNIYVTLAKREVFGAVGLDGIAGPTEVMVVADAGARPDFVAADLAAQLEHDPLAWAVLVTDSRQLADRVEEEFDSLVAGLERAEIIRAANCCIVIADDLAQAMTIANDFAPEHLLIVADDATRLATQVENAGAVFVGPYATVPLGDYSAGPNHTLPTSGAARFGSPLGVHTFMKRTSVLSLNRGDLEMLRDATVRLAAMEGLTAHAHAVEVRLE